MELLIDMVPINKDAIQLMIADKKTYYQTGTYDLLLTKYLEEYALLRSDMQLVREDRRRDNRAV